MRSRSSFKVLAYEHKECEPVPETVVCRIILVFNISDSKERVLEEWKYCNYPNTAPFERVEHANRRVIYGIDLSMSEENKPASSGKVFYKLLLQDEEGNMFYGLEMDELPFLHPPTKTTPTPLPIPLGGSLVIQKGTMTSFGLVLLRKSQCTYTPPTSADEFSRSLNDGLTYKYIEMVDRQLHGSNHIN